jgi:allophanate hydrolase subunit 2
MIDIHSWGVSGTVVDAGRPGRGWLGVSRGGAVDLVSHALANRLVGNPESAAAFETSGGLSFSVTSATMVVVTGGVASIEVISGPPLGWGVPVALPAGATVRIGRLLHGARLYVAVRGGLVGRGGATHKGPDPLTPAADHPAARAEPATTLHLWPGPRVDWFEPGAFDVLLSGQFTVADTSRVGTRLHGPELRRAGNDELPSEGLVEGAVQVPPDGHPIAMLAGHPATGGYPVIAVVDPADIAHLAQAAPGTTLEFRRAIDRRE